MLPSWSLLVLAAVLVALIVADVVRDDPRYQFWRQLRHVRVEDGRIVTRQETS